jgi:hypothetical protein
MIFLSGRVSGGASFAPSLRPWPGQPPRARRTGEEEMTAAAPTFHVIQQVDGVQVPETDSFDYARVIVDSHCLRKGVACRIEERKTVYLIAGARRADAEVISEPYRIPPLRTC